MLLCVPSSAPRQHPQPHLVLMNRWHRDVELLRTVGYEFLNRNPEVQYFQCTVLHELFAQCTRGPYGGTIDALTVDTRRHAYGIAIQRLSSTLVPLPNGNIRYRDNLCGGVIGSMSAPLLYTSAPEMSECSASCVPRWASALERQAASGVATILCDCRAAGRPSKGSCRALALPWMLRYEHQMLLAAGWNPLSAIPQDFLRDGASTLLRACTRAIKNHPVCHTDACCCESQEGEGINC